MDNPLQVGVESDGWMGQKVLGGAGEGKQEYQFDYISL